MAEEMKTEQTVQQGTTQNAQQQPQTIVIKTEKSMGLAIILTFLFGPLGLLYATVSGGLILIVIAFLLAMITFGFGALITWPAAIIWAVIAVKKANKV